ncbi:MAG: 6-phosphofructokinase [Planctomycetes bacterium]|nr:6-phosphofructokinase [Planctomycetota bacterium]
MGFPGTGSLRRSSGRGTLAILVGGGPAPGINGVIAALTIEASNLGYRVLGIQDGYKWLVQGRTDRVRQLRIEDVTAIHPRGGSILGTSRTDATSPEAIENVRSALRALKVGLLASIGGDGTLYTASCLENAWRGEIRIAHIPKTIDNDLPLPGAIPTFGFQTARHEGVRILRNLMEEVKTTDRWCFAVTMGRRAGHLALGIGKAAGATLTLIGEEFRPMCPFSVLCDLIEGAILKRRAMDRNHGTLVLAEGIVEQIDPGSVPGAGEPERDEYGRIRLSETPFGNLLKCEIVRRFRERGDPLDAVYKIIGYELRCADPIPFDLEYTRDLGYGAMRFLHSGRSGALMAIEGGKLLTIYFGEILDPATGRTRVRLVDLSTEGYLVARKYMTRLDPSDFDDDHVVESLARAGRMSPNDFRRRFEYLVRENPYFHAVPEEA